MLCWVVDTPLLLLNLRDNVQGHLILQKRALSMNLGVEILDKLLLFIESPLFLLVLLFIFFLIKQQRVELLHSLSSHTKQIARMVRQLPKERCLLSFIAHL